MDSGLDNKSKKSYLNDNSKRVIKMKHPESASSFEVRINKYDHSEGVVALNGLSRLTDLVDSFDVELTKQNLPHKRVLDENGEVTFAVRFPTTERLDPMYDWPYLAGALGMAALKNEVNPTILIFDEGHATSRRATDIPVLHEKID